MLVSMLVWWVVGDHSTKFSQNWVVSLAHSHHPKGKMFKQSFILGVGLTLGVVAGVLLVALFATTLIWITPYIVNILRIVFITG